MNIKMTQLILIALLSLAASACGKETDVLPGGSSSTLSCNFASAYTCIDYSGSGYSTVASTIESNCTGAGGTYSSSACTTTGRIGTCTSNSGSSTETNTRYYTSYSGGSAAAQAACSGSSGTWTAN